MRRHAITVAVVALALAAAGCRYDPVPQEAIDDLPSGDGGDELHRSGQPCVLCHSTYEGAKPEMALGGTLFAQDPNTLTIAPVSGVFVNVYDARGAPQKACTNAAGNFYIELQDWPDAVFPLRVRVGNRRMRSLIGRDRSCASCHIAPRVGSDPALVDPSGAAVDSVGVIIVDPSSFPAEDTCTPASSGAGGGSP